MMGLERSTTQSLMPKLQLLLISSVVLASLSSLLLLPSLLVQAISNGCTQTAHKENDRYYVGDAMTDYASSELGSSQGKQKCD
jgi:hypothetical protein